MAKRLSGPRIIAIERALGEFLEYGVAWQTEDALVLQIGNYPAFRFSKVQDVRDALQELRETVQLDRKEIR